MTCPLCVKVTSTPCSPPPARLRDRLPRRGTRPPPAARSSSHAACRAHPVPGRNTSLPCPSIEPVTAVRPCEASRSTTSLALHVGMCCPCLPYVDCNIALHLQCVAACLSRAQRFAMGSTWSAPRLIGSELLACADNVTRDGTVDATELVLFATRCFVPSGADVSVTQRMESLVTGCTVHSH